MQPSFPQEILCIFFIPVWLSFSKQPSCKMNIFFLFIVRLLKIWKMFFCFFEEHLQPAAIVTLGRYDLCPVNIRRGSCFSSLCRHATTGSNSELEKRLEFIRLLLRLNKRKKKSKSSFEAVFRNRRMSWRGGLSFSFLYRSTAKKRKHVSDIRDEARFQL